MHCWGDEWFQKHGKDLNAAIGWLYRQMNRRRISYMNKEKWGCNDVEWAYLWDGCLYTLLFPNRGYIGTSHCYKSKKVKELVNKFHHRLYFQFDLGVTDNSQYRYRTVEEFIEENKKPKKWKGFQNFVKTHGILARVHVWQEEQYNKIYQKACKKWPELVDELISSDCSGYMLIKPGKYGGVDGTEIHNRHWTKLKASLKETYEKPELKKTNLTDFVSHVDKNALLDADDIEGWAQELEIYMKGETEK